MKNFLMKMMMGLVVLSSFTWVGCQENSTTEKQGTPTVSTMQNSPQQLSMKEQVAQAKYVFDVRTLGEFQSGHVSHAIHVPYQNLPAQIAEFVQDKNTPIYLYCESGGRSGAAQRALQQMGYTQVINAGGYRQLR